MSKIDINIDGLKKNADTIAAKKTGITDIK